MATFLAFYLLHTVRKDQFTYRDYVNDVSKLPVIDWKDDDSTNHNEPA